MSLNFTNIIHFREVSVILFAMEVQATFSECNPSLKYSVIEFWENNSFWKGCYDLMCPNIHHVEPFKNVSKCCIIKMLRHLKHIMCINDFLVPCWITFCIPEKKFRVQYFKPREGFRNGKTNLWSLMQISLHNTCIIQNSIYSELSWCTYCYESKYYWRISPSPGR